MIRLASLNQKLLDPGSYSNQLPQPFGLVILVPLLTFNSWRGGKDRIYRNLSEVILATQIRRLSNGRIAAGISEYRLQAVSKTGTWSSQRPLRKTYIKPQAPLKLLDVSLKNANSFAFTSGKSPKSYNSIFANRT
jgi:hypothetical protein